MLRPPVDLCDEDVIEDDDLCVGPLAARRQERTSAPGAAGHVAPRTPQLNGSVSFNKVGPQQERKPYAVQNRGCEGSAHSMARAGAFADVLTPATASHAHQSGLEKAA